MRVYKRVLARGTLWICCTSILAAGSRMWTLDGEMKSPLNLTVGLVAFAEPQQLTDLKYEEAKSSAFLTNLLHSCIMTTYSGSPRPSITGAFP
jgi:hypothetical protein